MAGRISGHSLSERIYPPARLYKAVCEEGGVHRRNPRYVLAGGANLWYSSVGKTFVAENCSLMPFPVCTVTGKSSASPITVTARR